MEESSIKDPLVEIPAYEMKNSCGYFEEKKSTALYTVFNWLSECIPGYTDTYYYGNLLEKGFRRSADYLYFEQCYNCVECTPIRVPVEQFVPSKSQRAVWRKNQDLSVNICTDKTFFNTDEKSLLFREYDAYHNGNNPSYNKMSLDEAKVSLFNMNADYSGNINMEYRLNGKLIGVGVLDFTEDKDGRINALSSNYFYYDVSDDVRKRSLGVYSVLKELELCKKLGIKYYYLGLYLPNCRKMNYKTHYKPYELLIKGKWVSDSAELCKAICDLVENQKSEGEQKTDEQIGTGNA